jgi:nucleotide-binding universal stress UspA family protein
MLPIHTIVFPTDFSACAGHAFPMACALARDYGARLVLVHVKPPPVAAYSELGPLVAEPVELAHELQARLEEIRPADPSIPVEHRFREGDAAQEIVDVAEEVQAELIVMATHGRTGLGRLLMGSVAEEVLRRASCPVLTLKVMAGQRVPVEEAAVGAAR